MSGRPSKPLDAYPVADLGDLPQPPSPGGAAQAIPAQAPPPAVPTAEAAALDFLDPQAISAEVVLRFPFRLEGAEVRAVPVRRLSGAEVGRIATTHGEGVELFDFYAAMTGLPKAVLRGLIDDDLDDVLEAARPFLCRFARDVFVSPTGGTGEPSPAAPAAPSASPGPAS